jgi:hypothetical protein
MSLGWDDLLYLTPLAPAKAAYDKATSYMDEPAKKQDELEKKLADLQKERPGYTAPTYQIPDSEKEYLANAKQQRDSNMPGYAQMKDDIYGSTAQGARNIQQASNSVAGTLGATAQLYGGQMKSLAGLDIASAQYKQQMADKYQQALQTDATWQDKSWQINQDYKDKAWNWNEAQKYGEQYNFLQSQISGANADKNQREQNVFGLIGGVTNIASGALKAGA